MAILTDCGRVDVADVIGDLVYWQRVPNMRQLAQQYKQRPHKFKMAAYMPDVTKISR